MNSHARRVRTYVIPAQLFVWQWGQARSFPSGQEALNAKMAADAYALNWKPVYAYGNKAREFSGAEVKRAAGIKPPPERCNSDQDVRRYVGIGRAQVTLDSGSKGDSARIRIVVVGEADTNLEAKVGAV